MTRGVRDPRTRSRTRLLAHRPRRRRSPRVRRNRAIAAALLAAFALLALGFGVRALSRLAASGDEAHTGTGAVSPAAATPSEELTRADPAWTPPALDGDGVKFATYLGSPQRRFYGLGPVPRRLDVLWKLKVGEGFTRRKSDDKKVLWKGTGWTGQPLVVREGGRDHLIFGGFDHRLRRVDALSGRQSWAYRFDDVIKGTPSIVPGPDGGLAGALVVAGSRRGSQYAIDDEGIAPVRAVGLADGREAWRLPVPKTECYSRDADASALLWRGSLLQAVESGFLYRLDPFSSSALGESLTPKVLGVTEPLFSDKDVRRRADAGGANVVIEGSPALLGDVAYVPSGSGHVLGVSLPDMKVVWEYPTGSDIDSSVVVDRKGRLAIGVEQQYVSGAGGALMLDPSKAPEDAVVWYFPVRKDSGIAEWDGGVIGSVALSDEYDTAGQPRLAAFAAVDGGVYVVAADEIASKRVRGPNGEKGWPAPRLVERLTIGGSISTPLLLGDTLVTAGYDNTLRVFDIERRHATEGDDADETFLGTDGRQWRVRVRERASFMGGAAFESTPLVWNGRVYVGCRDGWFYCLGEK